MKDTQVFEPIKARNKSERRHSIVPVNTRCWLLLNSLRKCKAAILLTFLASFALAEPRVVALALSPATDKIFEPPTGFWIMHAHGTRFPYGQTAAKVDANWSLNQFGIPADLPAFEKIGATFQTRNAYARAIWQPGCTTVSKEPQRQRSLRKIVQAGFSMTLEQNTGGMIYNEIYPSGILQSHEFDLNITPNKVSYAGSQVAARNISTPLSKLRNIYQTVTIEPGQMIILDLKQPSSPLSVTQAGYTLCVTLSNKLKKQHLFYQIQLGRYKSLGDSRTGHVDNKLPKEHWFFTGANTQIGNPGGAKTYGFADEITSYGLPDISSSAKIRYPKLTNQWAVCQPTISRLTCANLDLLPHLKKVIASGAQAGYGVDPDLSDWVLSGSYMALNSWGHIHNSAKWSNYSLTLR